MTDARERTVPRRCIKLAWCLPAVLLVPLLLLGDPLRLRRVAELPDGALRGGLLCGDTDHDGQPEVIFGSSGARWQWEVWEHQFLDRYVLAYADTGVCPFPPGIETGNFTPWDIGDIDGDSLTDLFGYHIFCELWPSYWFVLGMQESPDLHSYPSSLAWSWDFCPRTTADYPPCYFAGDLDGDNRQDIYCPGSYQGIIYILENAGNNQYRLAWADSTPYGGWTVAFGDFDLDGHGEWVSGDVSSAGLVWLYESTGDDDYSRTWMDTVRIPNGNDAFSGNDVDQDGKPEFFIAFAWLRGPAEFHLMAFEMVADNVYERHEVTSVTRNVGTCWHAFSTCGDVDADSVEEIVWTTATDVYVYEATGDNQYEMVWQWQNPNRSQLKLLHVKTHDLNRNGYNEVIASGVTSDTSGNYVMGTSIFELETAQLLSPNGGRNLLGGETCAVSWQVFTPPRCDSVSLFLRTDTTWRLDTIATGLAPADTPYLWVVPRGAPIVEPCHVVVFAYGPGWQYDESDSAFKIITLGTAEASPRIPRNWSLAVFPNPARGRALVSYAVPRQASVRVGLYDAAGRLVYRVADAEYQPGEYSTSVSVPGAVASGGIYFLCLEADGWRAERKLLLTK